MIAIATLSALSAAADAAPARQAAQGKAAKAMGSVPSARLPPNVAAAIGSAIMRQVKPCADRQTNPGPGADRIRVTVALRLNRDGSLAEPPRILGHDGVDDSNRGYVAHVDSAIRAIFAGCSPLRGLPAEYYDTPQGWKSFMLRYRLRS